jgi:sialate O-acetylesterase
MFRRQSNMALPLANTFSRFKTESAIAAGKYSNIRIKQMSTNMNPAIPWSTLKNASATNMVSGAWGGANTSALFHFSSTCYYFGESLTDELGAAAPPIGLIHTAWGGSMIEQWLPAEVVGACKLSCSNVTTCGVSEWWNTRILPYAGMTLKGWVWYRASACLPIARPPTYCCVLLAAAWLPLAG